MPFSVGGEDDGCRLVYVSAKLEKLTISEVSGVDDPANEIPGFMVLKAAGAATISDEVLAETISAALPSDNPSIVGKIKNLLLGKETDVTKEELATELDARFEAFGDALAEKLSKSVEPTPTGDGETEVKSDPAPAVDPEPETIPVVEPMTAEDITKSIEDALEPYLEILDKTLDRIERLEGHSAVRKSLDGQEGDATDGEPAKPTLEDAFSEALKGRVVTLTG